MKLEDLSPNPQNPRRITDDKLKMLKKAIEQFGDISGFVYNQTTKRLVSGHQRKKVIPKDSQITIVNQYSQPTKSGTIADGFIVSNGEKFNYREVLWDETTEKAANIAANQHGGEFDLIGLASWVNDLDAHNIDLDLLGFDSKELDDLMAPINKEGLCNEDEVPEQVEAKTKLGDLYRLGNHRLLCGDSTDSTNVATLVGSERMDMVFTDPPYGVSYEKKTQEIAKQSKSRHKSSISGDDLSVDDLKKIILAVFKNLDTVLADKSNYYVCSPQGGELGLMMMMMMMQEANLICRHMIIWVKNAPVFSMGRLDYEYRHEPILYGWSKNRTHHKLQKGRFQNSVWEIAREPNKEHPTMKPVELPVNAIENSCPVNGNVIDLFGGSGSTLIACEKTNRKCFMIELDPHYCDVIVARWEKYTSQKAEWINEKNNGS